jgi:hypothetical protein
VVNPNEHFNTEVLRVFFIAERSTSSLTSSILYDSLATVLVACIRGILRLDREVAFNFAILFWDSAGKGCFPERTSECCLSYYLF